MQTKMPSAMEEISLRNLAKTHPMDALQIAAQRDYDLEAVFVGLFEFITSLEVKPLPDPEPDFECGYWTEVQP